MEAYIVDWLNLLVRWLHLITASRGSARRSTS
jgi:uncharacterized membrane protein